MATLEKPQASRGRMELRLEARRKARYEEAAAMRGQTLTQWTLTNLDAAADRAFADARATVLSQEAFDEFCSALEQPLPDSARALVAEDQQWA